MFSKNISGELFPSEVRAFCKSITRTFACILLVVCLKSFPILEKFLNFYGTFYFFASVLLLSIPIVYFILPETKDVALEEVQHFFTKTKTIFYIDLESNTFSTNLETIKNVKSELTYLQNRITRMTSATIRSNSYVSGSIFKFIWLVLTDFLHILFTIALTNCKIIFFFDLNREFLV